MRFVSPSMLGMMKNCERCLWLDRVAKVGQPRGIKSGLPGGIDLALKNYYNAFRQAGTWPPEVKAAMEGYILLSDACVLKSYQGWQTNPCKYVNEKLDVTLRGAFDDVATIDKIDGRYHRPLDFKTMAAPKSVEETTAKVQKYYQLQMDCYALMMKSIGLKIDGQATIIYYAPLEIGQNGIVKFDVKPITIAVNPDNAITAVERACEIMAMTTPPVAAEDCDYCKYATQLANLGGQDDPSAKPAKAKSTKKGGGK